MVGSDFVLFQRFGVLGFPDCGGRMCGDDACNAKGVMANRFLAYFAHLAPFYENCSQVGCIGFPGW